MGLVSLIIFAFVAGAENTATGKGDRLRPAGSVESLPAFKVLTCMQASAPQDLLFNPGNNMADCEIRQFAPALQRAIDARGMSKTEFASFIANSIEESRFFTKLIETKDLREGYKPVCGSADEQLVNLIEATTTGAASKKATTKFAGPNIGMGLMHLTGMANRIGALDYLIQRIRLGRSEEAAVWNTYWHFPYKGQDYQIKDDESDPKVLAAFAEWYKTQIRPGQDLNIYNLFNDSTMMSVPGIRLEDAQLKAANSVNAEMDSSVIAVEVAMAYWRGRCEGEMAKYAANPEYKGKYDPASYNSLPGRIVRASMKCVKGNDLDQKSLFIRYDWYTYAKLCAEKNMP